jgi:Concanavalin A-like lectin/glucanases superfamily
MSDALLLLVPLVVLPIVVLLAFTGCGGFLPHSGDDTATTPEDGDGPSPGPGGGALGPVPTDPGSTTVVVVPPPYADQVVGHPDLIAFWRLDETAGLTAVDRTGRHDGTYADDGVDLGEPGALAPRDANPAAAFDGDKGEVVVEIDADLAPPMSFTVELWAKPAAGATGGADALFSSLDSSGGGTRGLELRVLRQATPEFEATVGAGSLQTVAGPATPPATAAGWWHVVLSYDGSGGAGSGKAVVYVNGTAGAVLSTGAYAPNTTRDLFIATSEAQQRFTGVLDEVAFYRVALDATTIAGHFTAATT